MEILDGPTVPESVVRRAHRELTYTNLVLGNIRAIVSAIRRDRGPVRRVLDIGCGSGGLLLELRRRLNVEVIGVDLRPPSTRDLPFAIVQADATRDRLPEADVAICVLMAHHLDEQELIGLIRNAERSCRRLVLLDLVRSRVPLLLFRALLAPFLGPVNAADGVASIRRAYTAAEFASIAARAMAGTDALVAHTIAPLKIRQVVDIRYCHRHRALSSVSCGPTTT